MASSGTSVRTSSERSAPGPGRETVGRMRLHEGEMAGHCCGPQRAVVPDEPAVGAVLGPRDHPVPALAAELEQHDDGVTVAVLRFHEPLAGANFDRREQRMPTRPILDGRTGAR